MYGNLLMNDCRLDLYTSWPYPWHLRGAGEVKLQDSLASMPAQAEDVEDEADDLKKPKKFSLLDWNEIRRKLIS